MLKLFYGICSLDEMKTRNIAFTHGSTLAQQSTRQRFLHDSRYFNIQTFVPF